MLDDLVSRRPVFDAHVDSLQLALDMGRDLGRAGRGHLDLERGLAGGLGSLVMVCWTDPKYIDPALGGARRRSTDLLREFHRLVARHPELVHFAGNGSMLRAAHEAGAVAGIPGIEGGHSIEESLEALEWFFERGVRVMTLVWNNHLSWIRSCRGGAGPEVPAGLSEFGREVVRRMNALGMVVDLSHAGEQAFYDALETSSRPVIASHSGCKAVNDHPRNLSDDQLRALAREEGVVGIVFCTAFIDAGAAAEDERLRASSGYAELTAESETELHLEQGRFLQENAAPLDLGTVVEHFMHAIEIAGIQHVGVGSDYDGIQRRPQGLEDATCYPNLARALAGRGLSSSELELILGGNMRRVFERATGPGTRAADMQLLPLD